MSNDVNTRLDLRSYPGTSNEPAPRVSRKLRERAKSRRDEYKLAQLVVQVTTTILDRLDRFEDNHNQLTVQHHDIMVEGLNTLAERTSKKKRH